MQAECYCQYCTRDARTKTSWRASPATYTMDANLQLRSDGNCPIIIIVRSSGSTAPLDSYFRSHLGRQTHVNRVLSFANMEYLFHSRNKQLTFQVLWTAYFWRDDTYANLDERRPIFVPYNKHHSRPIKQSTQPQPNPLSLLPLPGFLEHSERRRHRFPNLLNLPHRRLHPLPRPHASRDHLRIFSLERGQ